VRAVGVVRGDRELVDDELLERARDVLAECERIVLVLPSTVQAGVGAYGAADVLLTLLMTLGFGALFGLSYRVFLPRFGLAPRGEA
jgi:hypothetical protein